jgi:hypothetical protein
MPQHGVFTMYGNRNVAKCVAGPRAGPCNPDLRRASTSLSLYLFPFHVQ